MKSPLHAVKNKNSHETPTSNVGIARMLSSHAHVGDPSIYLPGDDAITAYHDED
jgi:hypothetical protein